MKEIKRTYVTPSLSIYQTDTEVVLCGSYRDMGMDDLPSDPGYFDDDEEYY